MLLIDARYNQVGMNQIRPIYRIVGKQTIGRFLPFVKIWQLNLLRGTFSVYIICIKSQSKIDFEYHKYRNNRSI